LSDKRLSEITGLDVMRKTLKGMVVIEGSEGSRRVVSVSARSAREAERNFLSANWDRVRKLVAERQKHACAVCGRVAPLEFHHVVPRSKGRNDRPENIIGVCGPFGCGYHRRVHGG
jgi:hypothetical protein